MNILYATDGSACAATAGRLLASLPLPPDARITLLSAVPESGWFEMPPVVGELSSFELLEQVAAQEQSAALQTADAAARPFRERGLAVAASVRRQGAVTAILEEAEQEGTDLIVVGSHGMGAIEHFLIGSVSERVARHAHCSVLVARPETLHRAIVAVDSTESTGHALEALARLPLPKSLELIVVHVLKPEVDWPAMRLGSGLNEAELIEKYDRLRHDVGLRLVRHTQERLQSLGYQASADVRCGSPAEELLAAVRESGADLIVTGSANRSGLGRLLLGSVSSRVLAHAPCSVLIARVPGGNEKGTKKPVDPSVCDNQRPTVRRHAQEGCP